MCKPYLPTKVNITYRKGLHVSEWSKMKDIKFISNEANINSVLGKHWAITKMTGSAELIPLRTLGAYRAVNVPWLMYSDTTGNQCLIWCMRVLIWQHSHQLQMSGTRKLSNAGCIIVSEPLKQWKEMTNEPRRCLLQRLWRVWNRSVIFFCSSQPCSHPI